MTVIARAKPGQPVLARDIATDMQISHQYLQKVLRGLVLSGILNSTRGIGGGFQLAKAASSIRLSEIIGVFDDTAARTRCPFGNPGCGHSQPCPVHHRWTRVVAVYKEFLETTTLQNLVESGGPEPSHFA